MNEQEFEIKREKIVKIAKWGGLGLIVVLMAPVIFLATAAYAGAAVAAVVAGIASLTSTYYLPVLSMRLANWSLKARKEEARKNPIETAENQLREMAKKLDLRKKDLATFLSKGQALKDDVADMRREDPEGADSFAQEIADFEASAVLRGQNLEQAVKDFDEATLRVSRARRKWDMRAKHADFLTGSAEEEKVMNDIMMSEAISAVMEKAHQATSEAMVETLVAKARSDGKAERASRAVHARTIPEAPSRGSRAYQQHPHEVPTTPLYEALPNDAFSVRSLREKELSPNTKKD